MLEDLISFVQAIGDFLTLTALFHVASSTLQGIVTSGSTLGSIIGMLFLATVAPALGNILGDVLDRKLGRGLLRIDGDLTPFLTRPISVVMGMVPVSSILMSIPAFRRFVRRIGAAVMPSLRTRAV